MHLRSYLFRKVTIIGIGLIGGSLGKAIRKNHLAREVVGVAQRQATLTTAIKNQAIDHGYLDVKKAVINADLVVLATPVSIITGILSMIGPHLKRNCIITDVGSSKQSIVHAAQQYLSPSVFFVGSHPLAGSEKRGVQYAQEELFKNSLCIMTPTESTHRMARERVKLLWTKLGCQVKFLSPEEHDRILAYISHLPHVVAYALMETIPPEHLTYAAQGLKDSTRIASSSPSMWTDICLGNAKNLIRTLDDLVKNLSAIRKAIIASNPRELTEHFQAGKQKRDTIAGNAATPENNSDHD